MLTIKENFLETIRGGHPDRFVNQYEYMATIRNPIGVHCADSCKRGQKFLNDWGCTIYWPPEQPGPFPMLDDEHLLLPDITRWEEVIKRPDPTSYPEKEWEESVKQVASIDRNEKFVTACVGPGILEKLNMFMGVVDTMSNFILEPQAMHELIDFLADWEIDCAKEELRHYQPEMLFHHDDWGSQTSLFLSPDMFAEFLLPAYKKIYGFWKANGVDVIVHHSDSYAAELVPFMIEMGVDVFQGAVSENNLPALIKKYGGQISFHAGLDNGKFDIKDWSADAMRAELEKLFAEAGTKYIIPGFTMGGPGSSFPGAYEAACEVIDDLSKKYF